MCRSIKTLFNFDPPATDEEIQAAALQFVRKLSGFQAPSRVNEVAFQEGVEQASQVAQQLLSSLVTQAEPRNRQVETDKAHARAVRRYGA
jgi:hypothetical protein